MSQRNANKAFYAIAVGRKLLPKDRLLALVKQADQRGVDMRSVLELEGVPSSALDSIEAVRARHAATCMDLGCAGITYLLPGQKAETTPCSDCGGQVNEPEEVVATVPVRSSIGARPSRAYDDEPPRSFDVVGAAAPPMGGRQAGFMPADGRTDDGDDRFMPPAHRLKPRRSEPALTDEHKTWAMVIHLSVFVSLLGLPAFVGPLIIWLMKKDESSFIDDAGRQALNFQLTLFLAFLAVFAFIFVGAMAGSSGALWFGLVVIGLMALASLVLPILAAVRVRSGAIYRFPMTLSVFG